MYSANTSTAGAPGLNSDTNQPSNPALHQAKAQAEVHPQRSACACNLLAYPFTFPPSYNPEHLKQSSSQHISLFFGCLSAKLAQARAYMLKMATYRICISTGFTPLVVLYVWNACTEECRLLACPSHRCAVRGVSSARSADSRGRGQYHGRIQAV